MPIVSQGAAPRIKSKTAFMIVSFCQRVKNVPNIAHAPAAMQFAILCHSFTPARAKNFLSD